MHPSVSSMQLKKIYEVYIQVTPISLDFQKHHHTTLRQPPPKDALH